MMSEEKQLELMESKLELMEDQLEEILPLVREIHTIVIGSEHNKNDSMLAKVQKLQEEVTELKFDKAIRNANNKLYMVLAAFLGTVLGGVIVGVVVYYITNKK